MTSHSLSSKVIFRRFNESLHCGSDECVCPVVVTLGTATVERRTILGVVQAGTGGAAQPVDASKEGQLARDK